MGSNFHHLKLVLTPGLLLTIHLLGSTVLVEAQHTNFSFSSFHPEDQSSFFMVEDVQYYPDNSSFLMNPRSASLLDSSCGRLLYNETVRMKNSATGAVASFSTSFSFQVTGGNFYYEPFNGFRHGDGFAFTFAATNDLGGQVPGSSLCLIRESDNGLPSNRLFAVEFDTFLNQQWNDSSDSHIGVNNNSMNSTWYHNLCSGAGYNVRNCSYLCNGGYFTAWIDYDSESLSLRVYFSKGSLYNDVLKPPEPLIEAALSLSELVDDFMFVGFSSSTESSFTEVFEIQSWTFTSVMPVQVGIQPPPSGVRPDSPHRDTPLLITRIVGPIGTAAALALAIFCLMRYLKRKETYPTRDEFHLIGQHLVPRIFTYEELAKATKNFNKSELLGSGGFGAVYKGTLPSGALVAVKRMRHESKHGEESFQAEAASLSQIRHRNLLQLRGWCHDEEQLFLVYDYMCNGSLNEWLFPSPGRNEVEGLPLGLRYSVLSGVAAALSYLHEQCVQCVLHRDIKSSNVLLDHEWNAYLGDFGLARLIDHGKVEKTTLMAGTFGYMAPEMPHTGKATKESDVYSFGVLVLEVVCGARPLDQAAIERGEGMLVDRVWRAHEAGNVLDVVDWRLGTFPRIADADHQGSGMRCEIQVNMDSITKDMQDDVKRSVVEKKLIENLLHLGLLCCHPNPEERPGMRVVSQWLQSSETMEMEMPPLPVRKPEGHYFGLGFCHITTLPFDEPAGMPKSASNSSVLSGRSGET